MGISRVVQVERGDVIFRDVVFNLLSCSLNNKGKGEMVDLGRP